jgi:hypothetical protein
MLRLGPVGSSRRPQGGAIGMRRHVADTADAGYYHRSGGVTFSVVTT